MNQNTSRGDQHCNRFQRLILVLFFILTLGLVGTFLQASVGHGTSRAASGHATSSKAQKILDRWRKRKSLKGLRIGIAMKGVKSQHRAETDADRLYNPASGTKLLTTVAAMQTWPLEKHFPSKIFGRIIQGESASGDLLVVGGGTPDLSASDLQNIASRLKSHGLRRVAGPLRVSLSAFNSNTLPPAYEQKATTSGYRASIGAFGVDYGAVTLAIDPTAAPPNALVSLASAPGYAVINNRARRSSGAKNLLSYSLVELEDGRMRVDVSGRIGKKHPPFIKRIRMLNPDFGGAHILLHSLATAGIDVKGGIELTRDAPGELPPLVNHRGKPLQQLLEGINTYSNNFMAETVFKHLGNTWSESQQTVGRALEKLGLPKGSFHIVNGSGLYKATRITPRSMLLLLIRMAEDQASGPLFRATLARSGRPGTLERRFRRRLKGRVHAKTGTLNEVVSLSGYVTSRHSGELAFAIFINDSTEERIPAVRREIDRLIRLWSRL